MCINFKVIPSSKSCVPYSKLIIPVLTLVLTSKYSPGSKLVPTSRKYLLSSWYWLSVLWLHCPAQNGPSLSFKVTYALFSALSSFLKNMKIGNQSDANPTHYPPCLMKFSFFQPFPKNQSIKDVWSNTKYWLIIHPRVLTFSQLQSLIIFKQLLNKK